jgi:hypothetical protein
MKLNRGFHAGMLESAIALALITGQSGYVFAQDPASPPANTESRPDSSGASQLPDSPGAVQLSQANIAPPAAIADDSGVQATMQDQQQSPAQAQTAQQQSEHPQAPPPREPVGTAAAETVPTTGVAASRPAGAALAPAKQRRVRSILIKVGVLAGAAAAIGATVALSQGSPSKPPGAR